MVYTCKVKALEVVEKLIVNAPLMLWVKASKMVQHFRNYHIGLNHKFQENGRGYYCWKLRKKNVKN